MAKLKAPLQSFSAHGSILKTLTFRSSNGQNIVSGFSKPNDYKKKLPTTAQLEQRELYQTAVSYWNDLTDEQKAVYNENAKKQNLTGFNLFLSEYLITPIVTAFRLLETGDERLLETGDILLLE